MISLNPQLKSLHDWCCREKSPTKVTSSKEPAGKPLDANLEEGQSEHCDSVESAAAQNKPTKQSVKYIFFSPNYPGNQSNRRRYILLIMGLFSGLLIGLVGLFVGLSQVWSHPHHKSRDSHHYNSYQREAGSCHLTYDFDYFMYTIRWPGTECINGDQCTRPIPSGWILHGLWPNYSNGSWPEFCCYNGTFKQHEAELRPLLGDLLANWPNLIPGKAEDSLWEHEWSKHGTCASHVPSVAGLYNYFGSTLKLLRLYPVQKWLLVGNVLPDQQKHYSLNKVHDAVESKLGKKVRLVCENHHGKTYLAQIGLCFTHELHPINCPPSAKLDEGCGHDRGAEVLNYPPTNNQHNMDGWHAGTNNRERNNVK